MKRDLCELKKLGEELFEYRVRNNLTQRQLSNKIKVSLPTIVNLENSKYKPSKLTMGKILMELGIGEDDDG